MVLDIITIDNDPKGSLANECTPIDVDTAREYVGLANNMLDTVKSIQALGLAANQVGVNKRMFVLSDGTVILNPKIVARGNRVTSHNEGCLSVPGVRFNIKRYKSLVVRGIDLEGNEITIRPKKKLVSFAIQHELDHLNGLTVRDVGKEV